MPLALRTIFGEGYSPTAPTEKQWDLGTIRAARGDKPPMIYCHGSGDTATTIQAKTGQLALLRALAQDYMICAADLGLQAWGNDTHVARIGEAIDHLEATYGTSGPVTLVTGSMGNLGGMGYARLYPENVTAIAAIIPATDLANLYANPLITADMNLAYPPAYDNATMGPTHSPVMYASTMDPDLPIHLFTASNDTITVPSTAAAFVAARPQTERTDLGALGHSEAAVTASVPLVVEWLRQVRRAG